MLTILPMVLRRVSHPPAVGTALPVGLGSISPTPNDALAVILGVLLVATLGEVLRRFHLGQVVSERGDLRPR